MSLIQITRSYANSSPLILRDGQLAYSFVSNTLYIGNTANQVTAVAGPSLQTTQAAAAFTHANDAYLLAETGYQASSYAFQQANASLALSNSVYSQANAAIVASNNAYIAANAAYNASNAVSYTHLTLPTILRV